MGTDRYETWHPCKPRHTERFRGLKLFGFCTYQIYGYNFFYAASNRLCRGLNQNVIAIEVEGVK